MEKGETHKHAGELKGKTNPNNNWLGKQEGPDFMSSNQQGLEPRGLKVSMLGSRRA